MNQIIKYNCRENPITSAQYDPSHISQKYIYVSFRLEQQTQKNNQVPKFGIKTYLRSYNCLNKVPNIPNI